MANKHLILASSSVYRRELLDRLGLPYTCVSPEIDETAKPGETPLALCSRLAFEKALAVKRLHPEAIVIGSDQVCELAGEALGKPLTHEKASRQLRAMSGKPAVFHTALCLIDEKGERHETVSDTTVHMRELTDEAIEDYLTRERPYNCAGSAKIERLGIALMRSVTSDDPTSLIGLPLMCLTDMLLAAGLAPVQGLR